MTQLISVYDMSAKALDADLPRQSSPSLHRADRYPLVLGTLYLMLFAVLAIDPYSRADWALEHVLSVLFLLALAVSWPRFRFSRTSYTLIFIYLLLHTVGAHYTYSLVPYGRVFETMTGQTIEGVTGWQRNHYDRLVHLCYGLLLAYPLREVLVRRFGFRGFWSYGLPVEIALSTSALYELIEWAATLAFAPELGTAYVGTQGDPWDAQKDIALATLGAIVAMAVSAVSGPSRPPFDAGRAAENRCSVARQQVRIACHSIAGRVPANHFRGRRRAMPVNPAPPGGPVRG